MTILIFSVLLLSVAIMGTSSSELSSSLVTQDKVMEQLDEEQKNEMDFDFDLSDQNFSDMRQCSNLNGKTVCYNCKPICSKKKMQCGRLRNKLGKAICHKCRARCFIFNQPRLNGDVQDFDEYY